MYNVAAIGQNIAYELGTIYFFPYTRLVYESDKRRDILFSCFTSNLTKDPLVTILLARKVDLIKIEQQKEIPNAVSDFLSDPDDIFMDIKNVYSSAKMLIEGRKSDFLDEINLNISWSRYRALFIPSARFLRRTKPIFRYLLGDFNASEFSIASFVKFLIEEGLGITEDLLNKHINVIHKEIVWYPILIGENNNIYEPAWKLDRSSIFEWLIQNNEFFKSLIGELKRRRR